MNSTIRIASFDFGPVHTSMCVMTVNKDDSFSNPVISDWKMFDWRESLVQRRNPTSVVESNDVNPSPPPPTSVSKGLATLKKEELVDEIRYWQSCRECITEEPNSESCLKLKTRSLLLVELRKLRKKFRPNIRKTFFSSYADYIEMISQHIHFDSPVDIVLLEHQAANFRYENMIVESMVAQHIFTWHLARSWPSPTFRFVPGAYKFKPFVEKEPKSKASSSAGKSRRNKKATRAEQHELNKQYSVRKCVEVLEERQFGDWKSWFLRKREQGEKCDDLADAYLQLEAFLRTENCSNQTSKKAKRKRKSEEEKEEKELVSSKESKPNNIKRATKKRKNG